MPVNFNVTPAISGQSTFNIEAGALTIPAGQEYTITNQSASPVTVTLKIWGAGSGGEGGYTTGNLVIAAGASIKAHAGNPGASNHGGGGGSGVYSSTDINVAYGVAGGGGGQGQSTPGVGGGTSGGTGTKVVGWEAYGGGGGTQSAAGAGGYGDRGSGGAGSGRNGGAGSGNSTTYAGGTGYGNGGQGQAKSGDGIQGGGGGGYFGGGGGGASAAGAAGGGGSGYSGGLTNGTTIQGVGTDTDRGTAGSVGTAGKIMFIYNAPPVTFSLEYLVVAGGGGGGAGGGGGGGGGLLTGTTSLSPATNYTVTVGTGGAGGPTNQPSGATKGGNSVFNNQTALGGGSGGGPNTGGSGGGGGYGYNINGGAGTSGQGNNGGNGLSGSGQWGGGGGGGAGSAGQNAPNGGGTGGSGFTSSISGTAVAYAGGGGGGQSGLGTDGGGNGGQGDGLNSQTEGAINRGGGGGGGGNGGSYAVGRNGGSGVVILKYASNITLSNPGGGLTYTTSTAVSGYNITTFTGGTGNVQFEVPPPNTLATRFFPDVYFTLIEGFTGTKKYIDGANGSNSNNGDTVSSAYATIDYALTANTSATATMFIILEGTYTMTAVSTGNSVAIRDGGNARVFVCCPGRTIIQWTASTGDRDSPLVSITNANSAIYGGIFKRNNNGRTTNYTVAFWKAQTRGNYYNSVFSETNGNNAWSYQYDNYGQNNLAVRNCTFFNGAAPSGNYTNAGTFLTIDTVFNTTVTTGGTETNVLKSQSVDPTTYVTSGVTTAGVYSGTYSWSSTRTLPPEPAATVRFPIVEAFLWGGGGGGGTVGGWSFGAAGGAGGAAYGVIAVEVDAAYTIVPGGGGGVNSTTSATGGGGIASRSGSDNRYGSGGGGYSGIFTTVNPSLNGSVIIAGGGGGGGSSRAGTGNTGGAGGGTTGEDGASPYDSKTGYRGRGGTQSAAGADASCDSANASGFQGALQGGTSRLNSYGGAGGGGYYGGSAGGYSESNTMAGGGGGSGYYNTNLVTNAVLYSGTGTTPGNNSNTYRGTAGNAGAVASAGSAGKVVLRYPSALATASGGTITTEGIYTVHTFTSAGTFTVLSISPGLIAPTTVTRGQSFDVILITQNVADNTTIPYTITGATSADLDGDPLSGNFTIVNNIDTITIQTADIPLNRTLTISSNSFTATVNLVKINSISARYLVVAGGGGGGNDIGGGGGAGGYLANTGLQLAAGTYTITVGGSGTGAPAGTGGAGTNGGNSSIENLVVAIGGGFGASKHDNASWNASSGGSGGGGSGGRQSSGSYGGLPGNGTAGQGNNGAASGVTWYPGGGGGAGAAASQTGSQRGHGGAGLENDILGTAYYWAGGGGGSGHSATGGDGGAGGGGGGGMGVTVGGSGLNSGSAGENGAINTAANKRGGNGGANTGGGGGGGTHYNVTNNGGNGGSGIVVIRYAGSPAATGGTITTVNNDTVHTFLVSGMFTVNNIEYDPGLNVNRTSGYNGDTIEIVYVDQTQADNATVAYTITGVTSLDIDGAALTGNFTMSAGIAYLTLTATNVNSKTLTIAAGGDSKTVTLQYALNGRYLIVAGGGGGGMDMGGGGGGGGFINSTSVKLLPGTFPVIVGAGGTGAPRAGTGAGTQGATAHQFTIPATAGQNSEFLGLTAVGGGRGGTSYYLYTPGAAGGNGGSGGGASGYSDGGTRSGGTGVSGQGFRGGNGGGQFYSGGGGGAGGQGVDSTAQSNGGPGRLDDILGTAYRWAGGGGGSGYSIQGGNGGIGGGGGGAIGTTTGGAGLNNGQAGGGGGTSSVANTPGGNGGTNTGGGGGGGSHYTATNQGGNGGGGIVAVRYTGGQRAVGGTVTTVGSDTLHTFTTSGTFVALPGEGLAASMTAGYFGDTFTVYFTANETNNTTVPYTITGVTSAEINNASLTGNFTVSNGIASLQVVTVTGTLDNKTFSISAYGYTATVTLTYLVSMTAPSIAGWGAPIVITIRTENLATGATVPYTISGVTTSNLLGASLTGNITIAAGTDPKTSTLTINTDPTLLTTQTITVTLPGNFSTSTLVTFISVPRNITLITSAAGTPAVVSTTLSDLKESLSVANQWDYSQVIPTFFTPQGGPLKISPTDPGDLVEQVSVATSPQGHGSEQVLEQVNMVGTRSSPTYVYSDGAPVAAPAPGEQLIQIWYIT